MPSKIWRAARCVAPVQPRLVKPLTSLWFLPEHTQNCWSCLLQGQCGFCRGKKRRRPAALRERLAFFFSIIFLDRPSFSPAFLGSLLFSATGRRSSSFPLQTVTFSFPVPKWNSSEPDFRESSQTA